MQSDRNAIFSVTEERKIGAGQPVFIIAEIGNNHQGNFDLAAASIEAAVASGADAVTFQYVPIEAYAITAMHNDNRLSYLKKCTFDITVYAKLREIIKGHGLAFSLSVEDKRTLDEALGIGIDFIKICSADLTNLPYLRYCATKNKPVFFSTGGSYLGEIETAYNAMAEAGLQDYVVYHTNSGYPTPITDANIRQMDLLQSIFGGVKSYCDHTVDIIPSVVAVARGAKVIEKHITTDRSLKGDDWEVSLEPDEFRQMVKYIRQTEASLGSKVKKPMPCETETREFKRKSIVAGTAISKGETFAESQLCYKVPGTGISPAELYRVLGKTAAVDIAVDVTILPEMVENWK